MEKPEVKPAVCEVGQGTLPGCAALAFPYIPMQSNNPTRYSRTEALQTGTLFPGLDLPFKAAIQARTKLPNTALVELMALDFAVTELNLYLDTHPQDQEALGLYAAMPGVLSGAILAFARGLGEFGATAMLAGNIAGKTQTLPLAIYSQVAAGKMSMAYQYVWIIVVISFLVVVLMNVLSRRDMRGSSNHKKKDNSVEAGGQDAKVSVELFADREADAQKGGAR